MWPKKSAATKLVAVVAVVVIAVLVVAVAWAVSVALPNAAVPPVDILRTASAQAGNAGAVAAQAGRPVARARARDRHTAQLNAENPEKREEDA